LNSCQTYRILAYTLILHFAPSLFFVSHCLTLAASRVLTDIAYAC